jgi:hypothetical protein
MDIPGRLFLAVDVGIWSTMYVYGISLILLSLQHFHSFLDLRRLGLFIDITTITFLFKLC